MRRKSIIVIAINILVFAAIWYAFDRYCGHKLGQRKPLVRHEGEIFTRNFIQDDSLLGRKPQGPMTVSSYKIFKDKDTIYNVRYTTDSLSRRISNCQSENPHSFALFFGGSFAFGEGLENHNTLPCMFEQTVQGFQSYNYSFSGYGTQQMYAQLKHLPIRSQLNQKNGIAIYVFISDHIYRVIGDDRTLLWGASFPYYELSEGKLQRKATLAEQSENYPLIRFFNKSRILRYYNIDLKQIFLKKKALKTTAALIEESAKLFHGQFENSDFYLLIYPRSENTILKYLDASGIKVLDYSDLEYSQIHPEDRHPDADSNLKLSRKIAIDLGLIQ